MHRQNRGQAPQQQAVQRCMWGCGGRETVTTLSWEAGTAAAGTAAAGFACAELLLGCAVEGRQGVRLWFRRHRGNEAR